MSGADDDAGWVRVAARNNAELCDVVSRGHGVIGEFDDDAWTSAHRTPDLYPDAVTLDPDVDAARVVSRIDASAGASVKDSFAALDLAPESFLLLFSAEWIFCPADARAGGSSSWSWARVDDEDGLRAWESAWGEGDGTFTRPMLDQLVMLRGELDGRHAAGAVVSCSASVVGVSNVFVSTVDPVDAWSGLVDEVAGRFPGLAIVGYESGAALEVARRAGFRSVGPLRVWIKE